MPLEPMARAQPRRRTNHLLMVVLTTRGLKSVQPMKPAQRCRDQNSQRLDCLPRLHRQTAETRAPAKTGRRGPRWSRMRPTTTPERAPARTDSEEPSVNCQNCQPSSSTTGRRKTLTVDWLTPEEDELEEDRGGDDPPAVEETGSQPTIRARARS